MTAKRSSACDWLIAITILFCGGTATQAAAATQAAPEFYRDVLPILQENCQACHRINGANMGEIGRASGREGV